MPKCDACRAEGAKQRCTKCQGCWSCDKACAKRFWPTHKKFCTDDPALKPHVPTELAIERALAKAPKAESSPENATCYICLETEGPLHNGGKVMRGCACRGPSTGFAHVDCLAEMASRNEWLDLGDGKQLSRWIDCPTCHSGYVGATAVELSRCRWRRYRDSPDPAAKRRALSIMAVELRSYKDPDAADRLDEQVTRSLTAPNPERQLGLDMSRAQGHIISQEPHKALEILSRLRDIFLEADTDFTRSARGHYVYMMAQALANSGRCDEAVPFAVESVEHSTEEEGPESLIALQSMFLHAQILVGAGQVGEGKAALVRVLETETRVLGADHVETRKAKYVLDRVSQEFRI